MTRLILVLEVQAAVQQQDDKYDDRDQAKTAAGVVTPSAAVGQDRRCAERKQYQNDQQDKHELYLTGIEIKAHLALLRL